MHCWLLVGAAPFNGLLVLVTFVSLAQVAPSPLLLAGMLLWLAAPLAYLARAGVYTRPIASADELRSARRVQAVVGVLAFGSASCLLAYAATWEAFGLRLVGLEAKTSLFHPCQVVRYFVDFSGRALFVTALGTDLERRGDDLRITPGRVPTYLDLAEDDRPSTEPARHDGAA